MGTILIVLTVAAAAALIYWMRRGKINGIPEPPGNFLLGHAFRLGPYFGKAFLEWRKFVGPVFQLRFFHIRVITFNDTKSITKICALPQSGGRLRFGLFLRIFETFGVGMSLNEGAHWVEQRQFYQKAFRTFGIGRYETQRSLQNEMQEKLQEWEKLDGAPFKLQGSNSAYVFNAIWRVLASQRLKKDFVLDLVRGFERLSSMDTVGHVVAFIFPGLAEKFSNAVNEKNQGIQLLSDVAASSIAEHQTDRLPNEPRDVMDQILDKIDSTDDENSYFHVKNVKTGYALYDFVAASLDTSSTVLEWLMLYLAQSPNVASKLYSEIDRILGDNLDYWPTLSDRDNMPYTQACILEALRIGSVTPIAFPHVALEDFEFDGALIPKGTILILNLYGAHFDPEVWDQPQEFKPQRFLTPEGNKINVSVKNNILPFGAGHRFCPGNLIALDSMFLHLANAYRKFTFEVVGWDGVIKEKFNFLRHPPAGLKLKAKPRPKN